MKYLLAVVVIAFATFFVSHDAKAHVLVTDQTGKNGAILHIVPDDDPIAGKEATLFFDTQNNLLEDTSKVSLTISRDGSGESVSVETKVDGSLVSVNYTFSTQGVYQLRYEINGYVFEQSIRVSRGSTDTVINTQHTWAEGLLIGCGVLLASLVIVAWNRRKDIARQSTL